MIKSLFMLFVTILGMVVWVSAPWAQSPEQSLNQLIEGNKRFVAGKMTHPNQGEGRRLELKEGQTPFAAILGCADARVPPKIIFDQGLGDLFVVRVAGNTPDDFLIGSLEYAVSALKVPLILVLGHGKCGAVEASLKKGPLPGHIEEIGKAIRPAIKGKTCPKKDQLSCAIQANAEYVVEKLKKSQPILAPLVQSGKLKIVGGIYELGSGEVKLIP